MIEKLNFTCPGFFEGGEFPLDNTGRGADQSPEFFLQNLSPQAHSLAILLEDLDHPIKKSFTHWLIWNIPASSHIPANLSAGYDVAELKGAHQGIAYGWHVYAGPKPPLGQTHRYRFTVYALDTTFDLGTWTRKSQLIKAMKGHVLQEGQLIASFGSNKLWNSEPETMMI
ncbi:YbhB/YbcL family Raf kinase inhibitor-like protein [Streptococcus caballi]|uniref:YbhB/YbcL family Raf kinase inhibitor-like protein n=1 Tax=Streptococcus caballi TaxID=439220 RepID=UPI00037B917D|nr:YbhB/YbcL family Raf kinase inhibitor-like protein [Streptococcus caballi]